MAKRAPQTKRTAFTALTRFECDQVAQAVAAMRSGDPRMVRTHLLALQQWPTGRLLVTLGVLCERYLHYLVASSTVDLAGDGDHLATVLGRLAAQLPDTNRPSSETLFRALTLTMVPSAPAAKTILDEDPTGSIVALVQLAAACAAMASTVPAGLIPAPAVILRDVTAPD